MISLATVTINDRVKENIEICLKEKRIGGGKFIKEFEEKISHYMGTKYAIAICNGTTANIISLAVLKHLNPYKNEVIVPALTFIAQINPIIINGLKTVFVDVKKDFQIDVDKIEEKINSKTLAIFPVHLFGRVCDIEKIIGLARKYDLFVAEDCCEAFGAELNGRKTGTFGRFGTFSFYPAHTLTIGEGGMIITNDDQLAFLARKIMNHGRKSENILEKFHFDIMGFNGKMSNLLASIGCAIIDEADEIIRIRKENVKYFNSYLGKDWYASSPHCYPIMYDSKKERDEKLVHLEKVDIEARKLFSSLPTQENVYKYMGYKKGDFPIAEEIGERGLFIPTHQDLSLDDLILIKDNI